MVNLKSYKYSQDLTLWSNFNTLKGMATARFQNLAPERRQRILRAAMAEFATAGFDKGRLETIAKAAGVTKGLLYYYFEDREDVLATLYTEVVEKLAPVVGPQPAAPSPQQFWDWVEGIYRNVLSVLQDEPVVLSFMVRILTAVTSGTVPPGFAPHMEGTRNTVAALVKLGCQCGAIRHDLPESLLLGAVMSLMTASDRWIVEQAQTGQITTETPDCVLRLYRSAFGVLSPVEPPAESPSISSLASSGFRR
ncbi:MAG: TetR/AcrR family transcriptional regulator [Bryobacteraceae bacterium]|nr:TetR/AcrR family transcriptional regulator [Bryobacteraceae bacterium]